MIAFITDWGTDSYYVSTVKSVIKQINTKVDIIDISHNMEKFNILSYNHILYRVSKEFKEGTIILAVIDPTVGSERKAILLETTKPKYYFIAPDNGILSKVSEEYGIKKIIELNNKKYHWSNSYTFHGRDIFGSCAGYLSKNVKIKYFGDTLCKLVKINDEKPYLNNDTIFGKIIFQDSFGNLETDIFKDYGSFFNKKYSYEIIINDKRNKINFKDFYDENNNKDLLMHFDSSEFLEISLNQNSASDYSMISEYPTFIKIKRFS